MHESTWVVWEGGGQDQLKPSARAPALPDLVNPGGRKPDWNLREGGKAGNEVWNCSMGGGSDQTNWMFSKSKERQLGRDKDL